MRWSQYSLIPKEIRARSAIDYSSLPDPAFTDCVKSYRKPGSGASHERHGRLYSLGLAQPDKKDDSPIER